MCINETEQQVNSEQEHGVAPQVDTNPLMDFADRNAGVDDGISTYVDPMRSGHEIDAPFSEWYKRPVLIHRVNWSTSTALDTTFNPWVEYFSNIHIDGRFSNFHMARMTMKLKFILNGNPFLYGRAMFDYLPLPQNSPLVLNRPLVNADIVEASQRPNIVLNPSISDGGEMTLPMFTPSNFVSLTDGSLNDLGLVTGRQINALKQALGNPMTVQISVFAWLEDLELMVPTRQSINAKKSDEYGEDASDMTPMGKVEKTVGKIVDVATKATKVAMQVQSVAAFVGLSKPRELTNTLVRDAPAFNTATANGKSPASTLGLDQKNELSIAPQIAGANAGDDELSLRYIASKESYLGTLVWNSNRAPAAGIGDVKCINVDPMCAVQNGNEYHLTALAFAAAPFLHWRGGIKYRIEVVCSAYHRGRMRISYDPAARTLTADVDEPTQSSFVVDISDTTNFEFTVGYSQSSGFREVQDLYNLDPVLNENTAWGPSASWGNGVLRFSVVNELTSPDETIDNDIYLNVYVSGCDDLVFANPVSRLERFRPTVRTLIQDAVTVTETEQQVNGIDTPDGKADTVHHFGLPLGCPDNISDIHYGETINSFRELMKRYSPHEYMRLSPYYKNTYAAEESNGNKVYVDKRRPAFPVLGGRMVRADSTAPHGLTPPNAPFAFTNASTGIYEYNANMTITNYVTLGFCGWRGTNRWMIKSPQLGADNAAGVVDKRAFPSYGHLSTEVFRSPYNIFEDNATFVEDIIEAPGPNGVSFTVYAIPRDKLVTAYAKGGSHTYAGWEGVNIATQSGEALEFEVPYYDNYRFSPAKDVITASSADTFNYPKSTSRNRNIGSFMLRQEIPCIDHNGGKIQTTYHAIGEDFQVYWYTGPPPLSFFTFRTD
jgi:hypothetical protein